MTTKNFLVDPKEIDLPTWADEPPLPDPAPEDAVRARLRGTSAEPLVAVEGRVPVLPLYRDEVFGFSAMPAQVRLRQGTVDRLVSASHALPSGFDIVVLDGWRTLEFQAELLAYYSRRHSGPVTGYVSDPTAAQVVPPHVTGGAVDLTLRYLGTPLALGTDFDDFTVRAHIGAIESSVDDALSARLRRLLARVLVAQEFAPYPLEWWHWSFGDQRWAAQYGKDAALYGLPAE